MPLELPKFLTTEYASTAKGTVELHLRQFVIHTQHPRFIAVIEAGRLIPVDLMGHTLSTPELQAALDECADKFGLEFVKLMDALLDDSVGRLIAADLSQGFSLEGLESQGGIPMGRSS